MSGRNVDLFGDENGCEFHHVQMFVNNMRPLSFYKKLEECNIALANKGSFDPFSGGMRFLGPHALPTRVEAGKTAWADLLAASGTEISTLDSDKYSSAGQDIVEQLIVGLGWRVTAAHSGPKTRSLLVVSQDSMGVKFVITAPKSEEELKKNAASGSSIEEELHEHFNLSKIERFKDAHHGFDGIAVLGFELPDVGSLETTAKRYADKHPALLAGRSNYEDVRSVRDPSSGKSRQVVLGTLEMLEAFAYYKIDKDNNKVADQGTVLRFIHRSGSFASREGFGNPHGVLPGLEDVHAEFDGTSIPAYADHWVSNVFDRVCFLSTLKDVLGFTPKVDFNAGVVAAGRARIESTVTGNDASKVKFNRSLKNGKGDKNNNSDPAKVLRDQSQIYLPINNALSEVGHVHFFLEQYGQGVQHLASRVKDLVAFIERVNNYRSITGRGFSFLNIPRSYYGRLSEKDLSDALVEGFDAGVAAAALSTLVNAGICTVAGVVQLDVAADAIRDALSEVVSDAQSLTRAVQAVLRSRYSNLYSLLRDHFDEETYLQIVRNKVLVDLQGNDVLFQIFTCNILQRKAGDEAPFLEFIQRVCSQKKCPDGTNAPIKPGCGGFGIRNFLTLFLSIEVSKAMADVEEAAKQKDTVAEEKARTKVELFTRQLEESNPVLTDISDAMTAEGDALEELAALRKSSEADEGKVAEDRIAALEKIAKENEQLKIVGNKRLQELSDRYSKLMENLG